MEAHQNRRNLAALDAKVASYYDHCTTEELNEQQEWGDFASAQLLGTPAKGRR